MISFQMEILYQNSFGTFLTTGEPPPPVVFSASLGWLILSAPWGGMPELLAPCWEKSSYRWRLYIWELLYMASAITFLYLCSIIVHENQGTNVTTCRAPCAWKVLIWWVAAWCPEGIVSDTAITTSVSCSPWHDTSHLGFGGPEHCLPSKAVTPLRNEDAKGFILEGELHWTHMLFNIVPHLSHVQHWMVDWEML
jgi:hypothetical protein